MSLLGQTVVPVFAESNKMFFRPPQRLVTILDEIINRYHPDFGARLASGEKQSVTSAEIIELQQSAGDEFIKTGLRFDDEPNERGLLIEDLIDWLGRQRT